MFQSQLATLKERLKSNKHKASRDDEIYLYNADVDETTYLMCYIRSLPSRLVSISMVSDRVELRVGDAHDTPHCRAEATLRCKRTHENKVLMIEEGACTTPTKIDGIITDKNFNPEVAIIEISGPSNKVDNTHYLEDKKKTAKNLRYMYKAIMSLKSKPSLGLQMSLKVFYGFHIDRSLRSLGQTINVETFDKHSGGRKGAMGKEHEYKVRVKCSEYSHEFARDMEAKVIRYFSQEEHVYLNKTSAYTDYLRFVIRTVRLMAIELKKCTDAHSLTAFSLMSLVASSFPSSPSKFCVKASQKDPKYVSTNQAIKLLLSHQAANTDLLAVPGLFGFEESKLMCKKRLKIAYLNTLFPHLDVAKEKVNLNEQSGVPKFMKGLLTSTSEYARKERFRFNPILYENRNPTTTMYANKTMTIFTQYGLSNMAVMEFLTLFFEEFFLLKSKAFHSEDYRPTIRLLSKSSDEYKNELKYLVNDADAIKLTLRNATTMHQAFCNLLPLPQEEKKGDWQIIQQAIRLKSYHWSSIGSRAVYLQLFLKPEVTYEELKSFREKVLALFFCYSAILPYSGKTSPLRRQEKHYFRGLHKSKNLSYKITDELLATNGERLYLDNPAMMVICGVVLRTQK